MLTVVSRSLGKSGVLIELARQLSLTLTYFADVETLEELMAGRSRRFVLLGEDDISNAVVDSLVRANRHASFGLIVCAKPESLRASNRARAAKTLAAYPLVEWVRPEVDLDTLSTAIRKCRRRLLKLGKGELEKALLKREFFLQYQPKVERSDGTEWKTREVEALVRWRHPEHGLLGPLEFLPEAEAFELIGPISEFVLFEAAAQLLRWRERGLELKACINLASSQLGNPSLAQVYSRIVAKQGLECSSFTFEVTESDIADSNAPHLLVLKQLREAGFRLSLAGFEVAASSIGRFEEFPFDEIKIHASALKRASQSDVRIQVLAAITGLAHNLGISVCAEGVEDTETFELLKTIECDKMQGFLISEAVMPDIIRRVYSAGSGSVVSVA